MADDIAEITFQSVSLNYTIPSPPLPTPTPVSAPISGTLAVDYTTNTVVGVLTTSLFGFSATITNFTLASPSANTYQLSSPIFQATVPTVGTFNFQLVMGYQGMAPSGLSGAQLNSTWQPGNIVFNVSPNTLVSNICFAAGTLIRTPRGDVPVETLQAGSLVVTVSGETRPVRWLGRRVVDCLNHTQRPEVLPIRISAGAFGPAKPSQDLYVSPGHAICVDLCGEVFFQAANLVNGGTIAQIEVDAIEYCHVELDSHDVLLANNLPAESYLAMGNRPFFQGASNIPDDEGTERTWADFCRPVVTGGPLLNFVRQRLTQRAEEMGWTRAREFEIRLVADGQVHAPLTDGETAIFRFPAGTRDVRIVSDTFVPAHFGFPDQRALGVQVRALAISGGAGDTPRPIALDDERLRDGLHPEEARDGAAWRWTKGELRLAQTFWEDLPTEGQIVLRLSLDRRARRRWSPPHAAAADHAEPVVAARLSA